MGDEQEIKFTVSAEGADKTAADLNNVKKAAGDVGKTTSDASDKGNAAFKGFGFAARALSNELGVTGEMARFMGHETTDMASTLGGAGLAFGAIGIAALAAYKIFQHFTEEQTKLREETIKASEAAGTWIVSALKEVAQTQELIDAKRKLAEAEFDLNQAKAKAGISARREEIDLLVEKYNSAIDDINDLNKTIGSNAEGIYDSANSSFITLQLLGKRQEKEKALEDIKNNIGVAVGKLGELRAEMGLFSEVNKSIAAGNLSGALGTQTQLDEQVKAYYAYLEKMNSIKTQQFEFDQRITKAVAAYDDANYKMREEARLKDLADDNKIAHAKLDLELNYHAASLQVASQALDGYIAVTGKQNIVIFALQKALAIGQIWVDTQRAAMAAAAAVAGTPLIGPELAEVAYARMQTLGTISMGIAAAAALGQMATGTWSSAGAGGTGAIPTVSTNPVSGLPQTQQLPPNIYISINGGEMNKVDVASDILRTIYDNNGSLGGLQVSVERSA